MPIIVPPPAGPTVVDVTSEMAIQRKNTEAFIAADPQTLALTPSTEARTSSGAVTVTNGEERPPQVFRLIPMSHTTRPTQSVNGGVQRKHEFTLLGSWDAMMEPGDWWQDERGERWIVDEMVPHNRYETRGLITAYGRTR